MRTVPLLLALAVLLPACGASSADDGRAAATATTERDRESDAETVLLDVRGMS